MRTSFVSLVLALSLPALADEKIQIEQKEEVSIEHSFYSDIHHLQTKLRTVLRSARIRSGQAGVTVGAQVCAELATELQALRARALTSAEQITPEQERRLAATAQGLQQMCNPAAAVAAK